MITTSRSNLLWLGVALALIAGLAYGYGLVVLVTSPFNCDAVEPAFNQLAVLALGILAVPVVMPIVLGVVYALTLRRIGRGWARGCLTLFAVSIVGIVMGSNLAGGVSQPLGC